MSKLEDNIYFQRFSKKLYSGDYDSFLSLPFMTRDLLFSYVKCKLSKKIDSGGTPILSEREVNECISETKDSALLILKIFIELGFIERTEESYELTEKGKIAIRASRIF